MGFGKKFAKINKYFPNLVNRVYQIKNNSVSFEKPFMEVYWNLVIEGRMILSLREAYNIYKYLIRSLPLEGEIAELGTYRGGSAKLISAFKGDKPLHLFDTFEGMKETNEFVDEHRVGDFADTSLQEVKAYLKGYKNIHFHQGWFPNTTEELPKDIQFCFVHLDCDLYEPTLAALEYFYPRLVKKGAIISHDYYSVSCPGVKKAFHEFADEKEIDVFHLWDTQALIVKSK